MINVDPKKDSEQTFIEESTKNTQDKDSLKFKPWRHQGMEPFILFPAIAIIALIMIWGVTLNFINVAHIAAEQTATLLSEELAETYEAQVYRELHKIDQALKVVKYAYEHEHNGKREVLLELNERTLLPPDFLFTVSIADSNGDIVSSTHMSKLINIANQDYFKSQLKSDVLVISRPQINSESGEWVLNFSRRLSSTDSPFSGIVVISVNASYFVSAYESSKLGEQGVLGILGTDGVFRVGRSGENLFADIIVDYSSVIPDPNEVDTKARLYINSWDGVQRYTSVRELYGLPLIIVVGLSVDERLADARSEKRIYLWRASAISLLLLLIIIVLIRQGQQLATSRQLVIEEHEAHAEQVEYVAYHDELTKLPNRSLFTKHLIQNLKYAHRYDRQLAVMFFDLDGFKNINDTLGHDAGDKLLQEVSIRLKACLRESDFVARLGGDEFVALLPELDAEKYVAIVAEKILSSIAQPFKIFGQECRVTSSIGVSTFPRDGQDEQTLTKRADIAMYKAKEEGKNNYQFYSEEMNSKLLERLTLESNLRQAMARNEFYLHYQPKRDVHSGMITGTEALLRWNNDVLGEVTPLEFIPIAEEMGLIISIGMWVIETACMQNVAWLNKSEPPLTMAVNFTARQFYDKNLLSDLEAILKKTSMDAHLLEVGVSERLLMSDTEKTKQVFISLKEIGVRIAIDNFGKSYASLATIKQFPIDTIKIDRSLICDADSIAYERELAESIISTGRNLSMSVLAQGIETSEQADFLREKDCNEFQGFYFNKPVSAAQITDLLATNSPDKHVVSIKAS